MGPCDHIMELTSFFFPPSHICFQRLTKLAFQENDATTKTNKMMFNLKAAPMKHFLFAFGNRRSGIVRLSIAGHGTFEF